MSRAMRAKMEIEKIEQHMHGVETLHFRAVAAKGYPSDGSDEDNTYAKFSPNGEMRLNVANPALIGKFRPGQKFYLDFTEASE